MSWTPSEKRRSADQPPRAVERAVVGLPGHGRAQALGHRRGLGRKREAGLVDQAVEQVGPAREHVGERRRMREDQRKMPRKLRPRLEQAIEVDAARQPFDDVRQPVERAVRIGPGGDLAQQRREHRLERGPRRRRAQRSRLARPPVRDPPQSGRRGRRSRVCRSSSTRMSGIVRQPPFAVGRERIEQGLGPLDVRLQHARSARSPVARPWSCATPSSASRSSGSRCVCASSTICTRCSMVRSRR